MRKRSRTIITGLMVCFLALFIPVSAAASSDIPETESSAETQEQQDAARTAASGVIPEGITIGGIDVSGMTAQEAKEVVGQIILERRGYLVSLNLGHTSLQVTTGDLGLYWANEEIADQAASFGSSGNVLQRYKLKKALEEGTINLDIAYGVDETTARTLIENKCVPACNRDPIEPKLHLENDTPVTVEGELGYTLNEDKSLEAIEEYLCDTWTSGAGSLTLSYTTEEPVHTADELKEIQDVLGQASTDYSGSSSSRKVNIENAVSKIDGFIMYPGETFSTLDMITPFDEENGYQMANSYANGTVVESFGGGICQVSTTLYLAVLRSELEVTERSNHSMLVTYVKPSMDAAIAESSDKDFKFTNSTDHPVYVHMTAQYGTVSAAIYGTEYRDEGHSVEYISETLSTTEAGTTVKSTNDPVGTINVVQSAHMGCEAQLYKVVTENGVEVSRDVINTSSYRMTDAVYEVGVSGDNDELITKLKAAIVEDDIAQVRSILKSYGY